MLEQLSDRAHATRISCPAVPAISGRLEAFDLATFPLLLDAKLMALPWLFRRPVLAWNAPMSFAILHQASNFDLASTNVVLHFLSEVTHMQHLSLIFVLTHSYVNADSSLSCPASKCCAWTSCMDTHTAALHRVQPL